MARVYEKRPPAQTALIRFSVQAAFLLLTLWIGARFYLWVCHFETAAATTYVPRPPGVEGWLPVAALMNLKYPVLTAFLYAVASMPVPELRAFLASPSDRITSSLGAGRH